MATLGSLSVKLGLDPAKFRSGLARSGKSLKAFRDGVDETSRDIRTMGTAMSSLGKPTALLAAAGAATSLAAAVAPAAQALLVLPAAAGVGAAAMVTTKLATQGLGDALSAMAEGDAEKAAEAMAEIAPAARPAVRAMAGLHEEFGKVQQTVQANVFRGLAPNISKLGSTFLPILKEELGGVATELGQLARGAIHTANTPFFQGAVTRVLNATSASVANLAPGVNGLMLSLGALVKVGSPLIEQFTQWVGLQGEALGAFLSSARGMEFLRQKLAQGKQALLTLVSIVGNVREALAGIFRATGSENLLATIDRLTQKFATWANSVGGQQQLRQLFASLNEIARALIAAFTQMAGPLGMIANLFLRMPAPLQSVVASTLAWSLIIGKLVSAFAPLFAVLGRIAPMLLRIGVGAGRLGVKLVLLGGKFTLMSAKAIASVVRAAAVTVANWIRMGVVAMVQAARMAAAWLIAMGPIGIIIGIVIALVALIIANWDKIKAVTIAVWNAVVAAVVAAWNWIKGVVGGAAQWVWNKIKAAWNAIKSASVAVWNAIVGAITAAWNFIKNLVRSAAQAVVNFLRSAWNRARSLVSSAWNAISNAVSNGVSSMIGFVRSIPGKILSALGNLGSLLWNAGKSVIQGLIDGIMSMIGAVGDAIGGVVSTIRGALPFSPAEWGPLRDHPPDEAGRIIGKMLASGMSSQRNLVAAAAAKLANSVVTSTSRRSTLQRAASNLLRHVRGGGNIFEDFSARGVDELGMNDKLAKMFFKANPGLDFGGPGSRDRVEDFLARTAAGPPGGGRVQIEIRSGGEGIDDLLVELLRRSIRVQGGDVAQVLGS